MTQRIFCGCGDQIMANDGAECGNCVAMRVRPEPVAMVQIGRQWRFDPMTGEPLEQPDLAKVGEVGIWGQAKEEKNA